MNRAAGWLFRGGWLAGARRVDSPNADERPSDAVVDLLVVHNISLPPGRFGGDAIERLFTNRLAETDPPFLAGLSGLRVSAHFVIDRAGAVTQYVATGRRAWHAGISSFAGRVNCNAFSVGVELEGSDFAPFAPAQYAALGRLTDALFDALPLRAIRGHAHVAPGRKTDPGPHFDWSALRGCCGVDASAFPPAEG